MSIHAQLSPEAQQQLQAQRRNTTISSIIIAALSLGLVTIVLGLFFLTPVVVDDDPITLTPPFKIDDPVPPVKDTTLTNNPKPNPTPPSKPITRVLVSSNMADIALPVPDEITEVPSLDYGESVNIGDTWLPNGPTESFPPLPREIQSRCSPEERMKILKKSGGTVKGEQAVVKALRHFKKTQNDDGSWGDKHQVAMTGMAILAYLGHCETPASAEFGETVEKGITYLVNVGMKSDDIIATPGQAGHSLVYEHGIATYALAESTTFCNQIDFDIPNLQEVTKKAGNRILDGQNATGGWVYGFANGGAGDNSVGFWQMQALKACKHTGIWPDSKFKKTIRNAMDYMEKVQGENGAIGYRNDSKRSPQLTGGAVLCMQMWGNGNSKAAKDGIEYIRKNTEFEWGKPTANLYYHYYNAQAMMNTGGDEWHWYNNLVRDQVIDAQQDDGSWKQKMNHGPVNDHMATCLATMLLEVYYRFLPGSE